MSEDWRLMLSRYRSFRSTVFCWNRLICFMKRIWQIPYGKSCEYENHQDKDMKLIVNISGGGCPDVPYLAGQMVDKYLDDAPLPRDIGYTLCAYALQIAYDRVERCLV